MPKIVSVIGARPQFIKSAALSRSLRRHILEVSVHTGQHYDSEMSDVFFGELAIPHPDYNLGIGSESHGVQTARMLIGIEQILQTEQPDAVLVYGDTNSTLAGALAASKLCIPIMHVEAGLRSFNRAMPEEINRVLTDQLSTLLFAPSAVAVAHLRNEGITKGVREVGDIMLDVLTASVPLAVARSKVLDSLGLRRQSYYLCTIHRAENTDDRETLSRIFEGLRTLDRPVVMPLHPRTSKMLETWSIPTDGALRCIGPVGYLDMVSLQHSALAILTDSGGVQKEAYYVGVPCVTIRNETEWVETVETGWNVLCAAEAEAIRGAAIAQARFQGPRPPLYGSGRTSEEITRIVVEEIDAVN